MVAKGIWALTFVALGPAVAAAQPRAAEHRRPCTPGTPEHRAAVARLAAVDQAIAALAPDADASAVRTALSDLAQSECFELVSMSSRLPAVHDAITVRHWWQIGGESLFESVLDVPRALDERSQPTGRPQILVAPDERHSLTLDTTPAHALASLLCHDPDRSCGAETAGWVRRAEQRFQAFAAEEEVRFTGNGEPTRAQRRAACDTAAARAPRATRFGEWLHCVDAERSTAPALPLGRFRAPKTGWIVLRGRRGHYAFCDEVRAYDLATGSAYVAQSCSGLALRDDGSVDVDATDGARGLTVSSGQLPVDALREAALMTMLAQSVDDRVSEVGWYETLPAGVDMQWNELSFGGLGLRGWITSGQTRLSWTWIDGGRAVASGALTWPESSSAGDMHADELWRVAEGGLVAGCAPAVLPSSWPLAPSHPSASRLDVDPDTERSVTLGLLGTLGVRASGLACPGTLRARSVARPALDPSASRPSLQAR